MTGNSGDKFVSAIKYVHAASDAACIALGFAGRATIPSTIQFQEEDLSVQKNFCGFSLPGAFLLHVLV